MQPRLALLRHAGKQKWPMLSLPLHMDSRRSRLRQRHRFQVSRTLLSGTRFPNLKNVEAIGQAGRSNKEDK